MIVQKIT